MRVLYVSLALASVAVASGCSREPADANALQAPAGSAVVATTPTTTAEPQMKIIERAPARTVATSSAPRRSTSTTTTTRRSTPRTAEPEVYRPVETVYAPQPTVVTEKQVKRDAIIGAGVGAVAGAVLNGDNRVKGGIVGAVLGGAAGAAVGATIDKKTRVVYPQP